MSISDILSVAGVIGLVVLGVLYVGFAILLESGDCSESDEGDLDDIDIDEHYDD